MRNFFLIATLFTFGHAATAQRPAADVAIGDQENGDNNLAWRKVFESFSSPKAGDGLVLLVITNDSPWPANRREPKNVNDDQVATTFWCKTLLEDSLRRLFSDQIDLRKQLRLQFIAAGLPPELTAGESAVTPAGAIVVCCDRQNRLLSFTVGVPEASDLATMIKDATETRLLIDRATDDPQTVIDRLADRSRSRLSRLFQESLAELLTAAHIDGDDENNRDPTVIRNRIKVVSEDIEPIYFLDASLRFGLSKNSDGNRMRVLEQHVETRRQWCELMIPFVAGVNLTDSWRPLVESIWGYSPTMEDDRQVELLQWVKLHLETGAIVLQLKPPMQVEHISWPPPPDAVSKRRQPWRDVHTLALSHPFRMIDAGQAGYLIHELDLRPINIYQPSLARYLFLQPQKRDPFVVREGDRPGRFAGILKRSKTELVKK
jgi:hypothetical protein